MTNCAASFKQRNSFRSLTSFIICIPDMLVVHRKNKHKHTSQNQNICSSKPPCRPTHPRRVRPETAGPVDHISSFQSTRPRGVRLLLHHLANLTFNVSIHAPARGATVRRKRQILRGLREVNLRTASYVK